MQISFEYQKKECKSAYGEMQFRVHYVLETTSYGIVNKYEVVAKVDGLESGRPTLRFIESKPLTNNEETIALYKVIDIFEDWVNP